MAWQNTAWHGMDGETDHGVVWSCPSARGPHKSSGQNQPFDCQTTMSLHTRKKSTANKRFSIESRPTWNAFGFLASSVVFKGFAL